MVVFNLSKLYNLDMKCMMRSRTGQLFTFYNPAIWIALYLVLSQCTSREDRDLKQGKMLAEKHCASCHQLPDPQLLTKTIWTDHVLPAMAEKLGIEVLEGNIYLHQKQSQISSADWNKLLAYYQTLAPDTLIIPDTKNNAGNFPFELRLPKDNPKIVSTTLISLDTLHSKIAVGDAQKQDLAFYGLSLTKSTSTTLPSPAVDIYWDKNAGVITCLGGMQALDQTRGQLVKLNAVDQSTQIFSKDLIRPIKTKGDDFDKNGLQDYIVCAFGHNQGGLYLLKQTRPEQFEQIAIRAVPGATDIDIRDLNADGWPDIIALFAHGDEGIWAFLNDTKGGFTEANLLRFPPSYGSSSFQVLDFNHDNLPDILYTAGDNSDYSRILKPYHGVYLFENTGNLSLKQTFFYPINGCTKARMGDFDGDGFPDICAIAFFADLKNRPEETFTYLKGLKGGKFEPIAANLGKLGRWICMDTGHIDQDGDEDIVLGNFSRGFLNQENITPTWNTHLPFLFLENRSQKKPEHKKGHP